MTDTTKVNETTPETRDDMKMEAAAMILAMELLRQDNHSMDPLLIAFEDLYDALIAALDLELDESKMWLWDYIHSQMGEWGWTAFSYNDCQTFFGPPTYRRASLMTLGDRKILLQAESIFPHDFIDRDEGLHMSDFGFPMTDDDPDKTLQECSDAYTDDVFVRSFIRQDVRPQPV